MEFHVPLLFVLMMLCKNMFKSLLISPKRTEAGPLISNFSNSVKSNLSNVVVVDGVGFGIVKSVPHTKPALIALTTPSLRICTNLGKNSIIISVNIRLAPVLFSVDGVI